MKVLFISAVRGMSGAEMVLARFLQRNRDIESVVLLPPGPLHDHLRRQGTRCHMSHGFDQLRRKKNPFWPFVFLVRWLIGTVEMLRVCRQERPDVIHASHFAAAIYSAAAAKLLKIPLTWHVHDIFEDRSLEYRLCRLLIPYVRQIIAVSRAVGDALVRNGIPQDKVTVTYNGVDANGGFNPVRYTRGRLRGPYAVPDGAVTVGVIALLTKWKGAHIFLQAIARLRTSLGANARFFVIGDSWKPDDRYKNELIAMVQSEGIADLVHFTGKLENIAEVLADLDVLVHCSIAPDPLPTVVLEAMAMGRVVIAANCGGVPEMVQHNGTGLLFSPGDVEGLQSLLAMVVTKPHSVSHLGLAARAYVKQHFSCTAQREALLRIWSQSCPNMESYSVAARA